MSDQSTNPVEYREIKDFPAYRVGSDGSVWTRWKRFYATGEGIGRVGCRFIVGDDWQLLKPTAQPSGHLYVTLRKDGKSHRRLVHRLILEAFVGPCPKGMECRHFPDRNPENNNVVNLAWATRKTNQLDMAFHGTRKRGIGHWKAKLNDGLVREIFLLSSEGIANEVIGSRVGVHRATVADVLARRLWKHVDLKDTMIKSPCLESPDAVPLRQQPVHE